MKAPKMSKALSYLVRAGRAGRDDLAARIPLLQPLAGCRVAVIGLGAVGAPSALELGRAGVGELRLLDGGIVEPGNSVRWPLGLAAAGRAKATVLEEFVTANYPYTSVRSVVHRIGAADMQGEASDLAVLSSVFEGADLIYDATAEVGLQYLLSDLAADARIPYLCASATAGAWGGLVARVDGDRGHGCWTCLQLALSDGHLPPPPADPAGLFQPPGCSTPTFTGAAFDLAEVSLMGVRLAVSTLCAPRGAGYPAIDWDVAVLALRDVQGAVLPPTWRTYSLKQPGCPRCGGT